jgi:hypothetical protein
MNHRVRYLKTHSKSCFQSGEKSRWRSIGDHESIVHRQDTHWTRCRRHKMLRDDERFKVVLCAVPSCHILMHSL